MRQKEHKRKAKSATERLKRIRDLSCKDISEQIYKMKIQYSVDSIQEDRKRGEKE
jgi:hypothetical protein